jgi:hypothetical protein
MSASSGASPSAPKNGAPAVERLPLGLKECACCHHRGPSSRDTTQPRSPEPGFSSTVFSVAQPRDFGGLINPKLTQQARCCTCSPMSAAELRVRRVRTAHVAGSYSQTATSWSAARVDEAGPDAEPAPTGTGQALFAEMRMLISVKRYAEAAAPVRIEPKARRQLRKRSTSRTATKRMAGRNRRYRDGSAPPRVSALRGGAEPLAPRKPSSVQPTAGIGTAAADAVGVAREWRSAPGHCSRIMMWRACPSGTACGDARAAQLSRKADTAGIASTIALISGGALVGVGAVLFFVAPGRPGSGVRSSAIGMPGGGAFFVQGNF